MKYSSTDRGWCVCVCVCGLVFLLLVVGLSLGNRFHKISGAAVAAQGEQSRGGDEQHVEADNGPPLVCWDSVREGSAGVQRCSDVAPLGLRGEKRRAGARQRYAAFFPRGILITAKDVVRKLHEPWPQQRRWSSPTSSCIQVFSDRRWRPSAGEQRRTNTPASARQDHLSFGSRRHSICSSIQSAFSSRLTMTFGKPTGSLR